MSGRPRGAWGGKPWRDAITRAASELGEGGEKKLLLLARRLIEVGLGGDVSAMREVGDRLDGKPAQDVSINGSITHDLANLSDGELAERIKRELASLAGGSAETADQGQLH